MAVEDDAQKPVRSVQASYANFLWGVPREIGPLYPDLGLATHTRPDDERLEVLDVEKDTPAAAAGFQVGDVLLDARWRRRSPTARRSRASSRASAGATPRPSRSGAGTRP